MPGLNIARPPAQPDGSVVPEFLSQFIRDMVGKFVDSGVTPEQATGAPEASPQVPVVSPAGVPQTSVPAAAPAPAFDPSVAPLEAAVPDQQIPMTTSPPVPQDAPMAADQGYPVANSDTNLFPTDALTVTSQDMADATGGGEMTDTMGTTQGIGRALSGIRVPAASGYRAPDAPGIPATRPLDNNLFAVLQAMGLTPKPVTSGMGLNQRLG